MSFSAQKVESADKTGNYPPPLIERVEDVYIDESLSVQLRISQDPSGTSFPGAGHGATVWDSSIVLSRYISRDHGLRRRLSAAVAGKGTGVRGCELGCGCALAGLTAFVLGCEMVLTDMLPVLPVVELNIEKNKRAVRTALALAMCNSDFGGNDYERLKSSPPRAAVLDWTDEAGANALLCDAGKDENEKVPFELILGADLMYEKRLAVPLANTIARLSSPSSLILIAHEFRKQAVDDAFFLAFREVGLSVHKVKSEEDIALYELKLL